MTSHRTVLVTGGAGYIGSHTVRALLEAGWNPVVFDDLSTGHREAVPPHVPFVEASLSDLETVQKALRDHRPWAVVHFAACIEVGESVIDPARFYWNNVVNTLNLLDAVRHEGVARLVFSSSAGVYGVPPTVPIPEDAPMRPVNPYGTTKATVERILGDYRRAYGLRTLSLRYFNACGAHPDGDIGEAHPAKTHLVECALLHALGVRPEITIFGTDYDTRDGTAVRDYVHVMDLAHAHLLALEALDRKDLPPAYNVGLGTGFTVQEVLDAVERITGRTLNRTLGPRRPGDPPALVADPSRIRQDLGWTPRYQTLDAMVASAWQWHRTHPRDFGRSLP